VAFRPARVDDLLGTSLGPAEQHVLLGRVGVQAGAPDGPVEIPVAGGSSPTTVTAHASEALVATVPTWRRDLEIEADIAEEIARVRGYELVPSVTPHTEMPHFRPSPLEVRELVRETLAGTGVSEVVTTALVSPQHVETFVLRRDVPSVGQEPQPASSPIGVTNPLSRDHSVLRRTLFGSLVDVVGVNLRHGTADVAVFEIGKGYARDGDEPREWWRLGFALTGAAQPPAWNRPARAYDLDDAKGLLELLAKRLGMGRVTYEAETAEPLFHAGRTARASIPGRLEAIVGELHPDVVDRWELRTSDRVIVAEVALDGLAAGRLVPERAPSVGRYPEVDRDLAIVVPEAARAADVDAVIRSHGGELLRGMVLFDVYRGVPLAADEKSLAYRLTFGADDRTLTEPEIEAAVGAVVAAIGAVGGRIRS
jgi:phenylalanyl-tRNA synthetase beta chain